MVHTKWNGNKVYEAPTMSQANYPVLCRLCPIDSQMSQACKIELVFILNN